MHTYLHGTMPSHGHANQTKTMQSQARESQIFKLIMRQHELLNFYSITHMHALNMRLRGYMCSYRQLKRVMRSTRNSTRLTLTKS